MIAGVLERKVWLKGGKGLLYPNMFILLVGGPGVGKTVALSRATDFWDKIPTLHKAPTSVSRASLFDALYSAERTIVRPSAATPFMKFHSLQICVEEFGNFLSEYESAFMSQLNHLYDNRPLSEQKRSVLKGENRIIPATNINLIAGTTPAWLGGNLPKTAWSEGFASRLILVYSGERTKIKFFEESSIDEVAETALLSDLQTMHGLYGSFKLEPEVVETFQAWYEQDCPPIPDHPRLYHYIPRRNMHFLKLCMLMSVSRSNELVVRLEDYQAAQDLLLTTEAYMPDVFRAMSFSDDSNVLDEAFNFVFATFSKEKEPVAQHRLFHFVAQRAPQHSVDYIIRNLINANMIKVHSMVGKTGQPTYIPVPRVQHGA